MKIILTRNTIAGGRPVPAGKTIEVSDRDGNLLVEMGKATTVATKPKRETAAVKPAETTSQPKPAAKTAK